MKCTHCKKEIRDESKAVLISCDGDFVCDTNCRKEYNKEMDRFCTHVLPDDREFEKWLRG